jgi:hypothetical protein
VKLKLTPIVEPYRFLRLSLKGHKAFHGLIDNNEFTIRPILLYRNSFAPVIIGSVKKDKIKIIMRLNYSIIFLAG